MKNDKFDFDLIIAKTENIKKFKASKKKEQSTSIKPLHFDINDEDSPLKAAIVERINARNLTYADIYSYCTKLKDGDIDAGQHAGYNVINGLRKRHTMIDTTFSLLCDFLDIDILLQPRKKEDIIEGEVTEIKKYDEEKTDDAE